MASQPDRKKSPGACLALWPLILGGIAAQDPMPQPTVAEGIGEELDAWCTAMAEFGMSGALLVEHEGKVVLHRGYGIAERGSGRAITHRTRFDIGSLAKQFTATAVMTLVDTGQLDIDDTLGDLLDDVPEDKAAITVHQMLTHQAGLPYHAGGLPHLQVPLEAQPGEVFAYSNVGYSLLARIVEQRTGSDMDAALRGLFEKAGAPDIARSGSPIDWDDLAHGYVDDADLGSPERPPFTPSSGAAGYACTVGELFQWVRALESGTVLRPASVQRMWTDHVDPDHPHRGYGYGWNVVETIRGTPVIMHAGTYNGFNSELRRYPDEQRTLVFLSNAMSHGREMREAVVNRVALLLTGTEVPQPPRTEAWDAEAAAAFAGAYRTAEGAALDVRAGRDHLVVSAEGQDGLDLLFPLSVEAPDLVRAASERCVALARAVAADDAKAARAEISPAWVWPLSYDSLRQTLGTAEDIEPTVLGCAVVGTSPAVARCLLRVASAGSDATFELVVTRRGVLSGRRTDAPLGRHFLRTGEAAFAAFDIFSGERVDVSFATGGDTPSLALRSPTGETLAHRAG